MTPAVIDSDTELKSLFDRDGFALVGRVLDPDLLRRLGERIDAMCDGSIALPDDLVRFHHDLAWGAGTGVSRRDAVWQILSAHVHDAVVAEVAAYARTRALAALLCGTPEVVGSQIITKPARHGAVVPWHQDSSYWGQREVATCWIAVDDATRENGCMRMIPGSHLLGQRPFTPRRFAAIGSDLRVTDEVPEERQVHVEVPAGWATFHSPWTLHASGANASHRRRRAIAITYGARGAAN